MNACSTLWKNRAGWCALTWTKTGLAAFDFGFSRKRDAEKHVSSRGAIVRKREDVPPDAEKATRLLDKYFDGEKVEFDVALDQAAATEFQKRVWRATAAIPYGETRNYAEVARAVGADGAARAAGNALNANPLPIIVPCHRVVRSDGSTGGFAAGPDVKAALLALERGEKRGAGKLYYSR